MQDPAQLPPLRKSSRWLYPLVMFPSLESLIYSQLATSILGTLSDTHSDAVPVIIPEIRASVSTHTTQNMNSLKAGRTFFFFFFWTSPEGSYTIRWISNSIYWVFIMSQALSVLSTLNVLSIIYALLHWIFPRRYHFYSYFKGGEAKV